MSYNESRIVFFAQPLQWWQDKGIMASGYKKKPNSKGFEDADYV